MHTKQTCKTWKWQKPGITEIFVSMEEIKSVTKNEMKIKEYKKTQSSKLEN